MDATVVKIAQDSDRDHGPVPGTGVPGKIPSTLETFEFENGFIEVTIDLYRATKKIKSKNIDKGSKEPISEKKKLEILTKIGQKRISMREAAERFNVPHTTIFGWKKASMEDKPLLKCGRPKLVDDKGLE